MRRIALLATVTAAAILPATLSFLFADPPPQYVLCKYLIRENGSTIPEYPSGSVYCFWVRGFCPAGPLTIDGPNGTAAVGDHCAGGGEGCNCTYDPGPHP